MAATTLSTAHLTALRESVLIDPGLSLFYPKAFEYGMKSMREANQVLEKHILCAPDPTRCFATIGEMISFIFSPDDEEEPEWESEAEEREVVDKANRDLNYAEVAFQAADNEAMTYDLKHHRSAARQVVLRRQVHRASRRPARKAGTKASGGGDDGDGDGEPPRRSSLAQQLSSRLKSVRSNNGVSVPTKDNTAVARPMGGSCGESKDSPVIVAGTLTRKQSSTKPTRLASGKDNIMDTYVHEAGTRETYVPTQLFSYQSTAILFDCATQTIKNKVVLGTFPKPLQTPVGPRFTADQIQAVVSGEWQPPKSEKSPVSPPPRGRGRPRIAQQASQGVRS
jgi:hypothetical protein